jgi:hypothetical protein
MSATTVPQTVLSIEALTENEKARVKCSHVEKTTQVLLPRKEECFWNLTNFNFFLL